MKRIMPIALSGLAAVALAACGSTTTKTVTATTPAPTTPTAPVTPTTPATTPAAPTPVGFQVMPTLEASVLHTYNNTPPITVQASDFSCALVDGTNDQHAVCVGNIVGSTQTETRYVTISADGHSWADSAHAFPASAASSSTA
jgi:hypothetical protein